MKLKDAIDKKFIQAVAELTQNYSLSHAKFDSKKFEKSLLGKNWDELELKQRIRKISSTLHEHLGDNFTENILTLRKVSEELHAKKEKLQISTLGLFVFPDYVEVFGLNHWKASMLALEHLTQHSTGEFAIRAFFKKDFEKTLKQMQEWSKHSNYHVRRLSSEGSRPRLPWGQAITMLNEMIHTLDILEQLKNDPELYVRKSVANHLNDISKKFPEDALKIGSRWHGATENQSWVVKQAFRGLLKKGHPAALKVFGFKSDKKSLDIKNFKLPTKVQMGKDLNFSFELGLKKDQLLRLEFAILFLRANGKHNKKVFLISEKEFKKGTHTLSKKYSFKKITTRRYYEGSHILSLIVNGVEADRRAFLLV